MEAGIRLYSKLSRDSIRHGIAVSAALHTASAIVQGLIVDEVRRTNRDLAEEIEEADNAEAWGLLLILANGSYVADISDREDIEELLEAGSNILRAGLSLDQDGE